MSATRLTNRKPSAERHDVTASSHLRRLGRSHLEPKAGTSAPMLLSYDEIEDWRQDNPYILHGYRPLSRSIAKSLLSWTYLHTETMNIYSHLVPAIFVLTAGSFAYRVFLSSYPLAAVDDLAVLAFFLISAVTCFSFSAGYHTLENHSKHVSNMSLRCDYMGIILLILGDFVSGIRMGFFCEPTLRIVYWTMILVLGTLTGLLLLGKQFQGPRYRSLRLAAFISTGLSAIAPIIHGMIRFGFVQLVRQSGLKYYLIEGFLILIGASLYGYRFPESFAPGRFDIWGGSHQLFHTLVVIATAVHFAGLYEAYEYNYTFRKCGIQQE